MGATNLKVGGRWGVNIVKTLTFENGGGYMTSPAPMVAPPLTAVNQPTVGYRPSSFSRLL